jgi:hypothetical protein
MKSLLPVAALLLILTGCSSPSPSGQPVRNTKAATLQEHAPSVDASPANKEIRCHIQMIDGIEAASSDKLQPGHHRVIVALGSNENEHVGDVDLLIPAAKSYRLKAERNDETFTLSLLEDDTGKVAATSAALVSQVMKFKVFVSQK